MQEQNPICSGMTLQLNYDAEFIVYRRYSLLLFLSYQWGPCYAWTLSRKNYEFERFKIGDPAITGPTNRRYKNGSRKISQGLSK